MALARADLRNAVGGALQGATPNAEQLDEALRGGLDLVVRRAPLCEAAVTLLTAGRVVNLGALIPDLFEVCGIYMDGQREGALHAVRWRFHDTDTIELEGVDEPAAGTVLNVRYRRAYTVRGLDGAVATTLPGPFERPFINAAAGEYFELRAAAVVVVDGEAESKFAPDLGRIARMFRTKALAALNDRSGLTIVPFMGEV
jgi:hypothetical protein